MSPLGFFLRYLGLKGSDVFSIPPCDLAGISRMDREDLEKRTVGCGVGTYERVVSPSLIGVNLNLVLNDAQSLSSEDSGCLRPLRC